MLPQAFQERMQGMLGEEYGDFIQSLEGERYQALRCNPLKRDRDGEVGQDLLQRAFDLTPVSWEENGYYYGPSDQPGKHPYHEAGLYYIQEPSAMAPVPLLEVQPGERILDLCAAPGGKSTQIAAALQGKGLLITNEIHPTRAKILSENIERMGVWNACVTNESPQHLSEVFPGYFDRILVDAPCSGEGMFRKNEEAAEQWSQENVELCARRQSEILDCAAVMLREGGRMVYSTCTFATEENEEGIAHFLQRHSEFTLLRTLRLWPHQVKGEGHFAAVLIKGTAETPAEGSHGMAATGIEKGVMDKALGEAAEFLQEQLTVALRNYGNLLLFGEQLYLMPPDLPGLKGLKVLRPGLHIGTLKKNRFEPSHALALALSPTQAKHMWNLTMAEEELVRAYLRGETFPAEGEKGWYLICVDGYSMGWGKLAGGMMKNHYPKGLRKPW